MAGGVERSRFKAGTGRPRCEAFPGSCFLPPDSPLLLPPARVHIIVVKNHYPGDFMETKHSFFSSRIVAAVATLALTAGTAAVAQQTTTPSSSTASTQSSTTTTTTTTKKST